MSRTKIKWAKALQYYITDETLSYEDVAKTFNVSLTQVKEHGAEENWVQLKEETRKLFRTRLIDTVVDLKIKKLFKDKDELVKELKKIEQAEEKQHIVYVIGNTTLAVYKIGRSSNYKVRRSVLAVTFPFEIDTEILIITGNEIVLEKELHNKFSSKRRKGEWFTLTKEDLDYLKELSKNGKD